MAQIIPLSGEGIRSGFTHVVKLFAADIAAMTSGSAYSIYPGYNGATTSADLLVRDALLVVKTAFNAFQSDGTTAVTLTLQVGDGSTGNAFIAATDLKTAATPAAAFNATKPAIPAGSIIKVTPTFGASGDPTKTSAGEAHIYLTLTQCSTLDRGT